MVTNEQQKPHPASEGMLTVVPRQRGDLCKGHEAIHLVPFLDLTSRRWDGAGGRQGTHADFQPLHQHPTPPPHG